MCHHHHRRNRFVVLSVSDESSPTFHVDFHSNFVIPTASEASNDLHVRAPAQAHPSITSTHPPSRPPVRCSLPVIIILIIVICLWPRSFLGRHSSRNHPEKFESARVRITVVVFYLGHCLRSP